MIGLNSVEQSRWMIRERIMGDDWIVIPYISERAAIAARELEATYYTPGTPLNEKCEAFLFPPGTAPVPAVMMFHRSGATEAEIMAVIGIDDMEAQTFRLPNDGRLASAMLIMDQDADDLLLQELSAHALIIWLEQP